MTYADLIEFFGTQATAARAIGVPRQTVNRWKKSGKVPKDQQLKYEVATEGRLPADIPAVIRRWPHTEVAA